MPLSIRSLAGTIALATRLAHLVPAQRDLSIKSVISWLPSNVETLIVAHHGARVGSSPPCSFQ